MHRIFTEEPTALRSARPDCPEPVAELVHSLLAKNPGERPQPASAVAERLRALRREHCPESPESPRGLGKATSVIRIPEKYLRRTDD